MTVYQCQRPRDTYTDVPGPPLLVFYRRNGITVTSRYFLADGHRYEIVSLTNVMRVRGPRRLGALGTVIVGVEVVFFVLLVFLMGTLAAWLLAIAVPVVPCVIWVCCVGRCSPQLNLVGRYRGFPVVLLATRDNVVFGQVARALQRAIEGRSQ